MSKPSARIDTCTDALDPQTECRPLVDALCDVSEGLNPWARQNDINMGTTLLWFDEGLGLPRDGGVGSWTRHSQSIASQRPGLGFASIKVSKDTTSSADMDGSTSTAATTRDSTPAGHRRDGSQSARAALGTASSSSGGSLGLRKPPRPDQGSGVAPLWKSREERQKDEQRRREQEQENKMRQQSMQQRQAAKSMTRSTSADQLVLQNGRFTPRNAVGGPAGGKDTSTPSNNGDGKTSGPPSITTSEPDVFSIDDEAPDGRATPNLDDEAAKKQRRNMRAEARRRLREWKESKAEKKAARQTQRRAVPVATVALLSAPAVIPHAGEGGNPGKDSTTRQDPSVPQRGVLPRTVLEFGGPSWHP